MSSPSANSRTRTTIIPPDKGAFPLDHFKECEGLVEKYVKCLEKHELMPKRCQKLQMDYIYCRMKRFYTINLVG